MEKTRQQSYVELLRAKMSSGVETEADLVHCTACGEELRRLVAEHGGDDESRAVIRAYDGMLLERRSLFSADLDVSLSGVFDDLDAYSKGPALDRDFWIGQDLLIGIDDILACAVARCRAGVIDSTVLTALTQTARSRAFHVAPSLSNLWAYAWDRWMATGDDPDYPPVYDWIEQLGQFDLREIDIALAVRRHYRREADIALAVRRLCR